MHIEDLKAEVPYEPLLFTFLVIFLTIPISCAIIYFKVLLSFGKESNKKTDSALK